MDYRKRRQMEVDTQPSSNPARRDSSQAMSAGDLAERFLLYVHLLKAGMSGVALGGLPLGFLLHSFFSMDVLHAIVFGLLSSSGVLAALLACNWHRFKAIFPELFGGEVPRDMTQ